MARLHEKIKIFETPFLDFITSKGVGNHDRGFFFLHESRADFHERRLSVIEAQAKSLARLLLSVRRDPSQNFRHHPGRIHRTVSVHPEAPRPSKLRTQFCQQLRRNLPQSLRFPSEFDEIVPVFHAPFSAPHAGQNHFFAPTQNRNI